MRLPRSFSMVVFPAFLITSVAMADAARQAAHRTAPRASLVASVSGAVSTAMESLREKVRDSGLMTDTRPSPEQARRDFVALWADLEVDRQTVAAPSLPADRSGYAELEPGQD